MDQIDIVVSSVDDYIEKRIFGIVETGSAAILSKPCCQDAPLSGIFGPD